MTTGGAAGSGGGAAGTGDAVASTRSQRLREARRFLAYVGVGAIGTAGHYLVLVALVRGLGVRPVVASTCGFAVGAIINYLANYRFTFRSRKRHAHAATQFLLVALAGAAVNAGVMALLSGRLHWHYLPAQVVATGCVVCLTYVANRQWTFREVEGD